MYAIGLHTINNKKELKLLGYKKMKNVFNYLCELTQ